MSGDESPLWGLYSDLRPDAIEAVRNESPIAYVPWGALEWHCRHAPVGLDSDKAEGICIELARRSGGVVLPAIPMGVNTIKPFKGFPHSIDIPAEVATSVAECFCRQLADEQFRVVILFTGHYPPEQIDALQAGADRAARAYPGTRFEVWADRDFLEPPFKADHAGATETSFQMHFKPGSVDCSLLPDRELTLDGDGVMGEDPRKASAERGKRQLDQVLEKALERLRQIQQETGIGQ